MQTRRLFKNRIRVSLLVFLSVLLFQNCGQQGFLQTFDPQQIDLQSREAVSQSSPPTENSGNTAPSETTKNPVGEAWLTRPGFHSYFYAPKIIQDLAQTGVQTFNIDTSLFGDDILINGGPVAPSAGVWDFSHVLGQIQKILAVSPNARFTLRLYAGAPEWWKDLVPNELDTYVDGCTELETHKDAAGACVLATGARPAAGQQLRRVSRGSKVMMDHWKLGIAQLHSALQNAGVVVRVDAILLTGLSSQEWIAWDSNFASNTGVRPMIYGTSYRQGYQQWHLQRYGSALDVPSPADFQTFSNPVGSSAYVDLAASANVVHYFQYRNELTAKVITELAGHVKTHFSGRKVGAIYGYMNEMGGDPTFGHNGLRQLLDSTSIDYLNPMSSYQDRMGFGADFERQPITSLALNQKIIVNDMDQGTHVSQENIDGLCAIYGQSTDPRIQEVYRVNCNSGDPGSLYDLALSFLGFRMNAQTNKVFAPSLFEDISHLRRFLGYSLARDIRFNFLSLHNSTTSGAEKSSLTQKDLLEQVVPQILQTKVSAQKYSAKSVAQILVISDEDSNNFVRPWAVTPYLPDRNLDVAGLGYHALATSRIGLNKLGAPYDHILLSDLGRIDVTPYKLVIFLNAWSVDSNTRALIRQKLQNSNRVILWNHGSGLFENGVKDLSQVSSLVGINILSAGQIKAPSVAVNPAIFPMFRQAYVVAPKYHADCCDLLYAADGNAAALGTYQGTNFTSMAIRDFGTYKSMWSATVTLPPEVLRDLAVFAGVHIYNDQSEPLYANQSYFTVVANSTGQRTLKFPRDVTLYEAVSNTKIAGPVRNYTFQVSGGGVYLFRAE